ncbi:trehalose-phosphatase [Lichenihabitans sp. PAMC28606]|uniref:trehalose-phosphatase n=1 Tax=Lichenihabitans sp. PAMC28606 TaxID=2880932 RepID=UPI001D0A6FA9|nr:trehalose-phosphatase [Lichenihabitans sp. PAMC28606]UDL95004.1 trehalose-phosphatase [Lichenihabitans sp. PAMC28606]
MMLDRPLDETCFFFDVDGSLIDIAPKPDAVVVPTSLLRDLESLNRVAKGAVALVSGRSIGQLDMLFQPARFRASGVHGAEMRFDPEGPVIRSEEDAIPVDVWSEVVGLLTAYPGTFAENKTFSYAVHYRALPACGLALTAALKTLIDRRPEAGLSLMPGHFVVEIKRATFDKGIAIKRFLAEAPFAGRRPVFIGDDVTDQPGFAAALDQDGDAFSVGVRFPGTTGSFASPAAVRHWVARIVETESLHA